MTKVTVVTMRLINFIILLIFSMTVSASPTDSLQGLVGQLEQVKKESEISAALILIVDRNKVILSKYLGKPSWQSTQTFSSAHMFRVGSISKSFAALLALRMQEQDKIDLSAPLSQYVMSPSLLLKNSFNAKITLAQLLEHTAGLADLKKAEWDYNDPEPISTEQALGLNKGEHQALWSSGMHSSYSNIGVAYLGLALEKASGKTYENLMQKWVFNPLKMQSSSLLLSDNVKTRLIEGYDRDGKTPIPYWHNIYRPFAAINTDANDMVLFLQMLLNGGKIHNKQFLSSASLERMRTPHTTLAAKSGLSYGYGLGTYQWQNEGISFFGHGGDADGYLARYAYNPQTGLAYFMMINAFNHRPLARIREILEQYIISRAGKSNYPLRLKLSKKTLNKYIGDYVITSKRFGKISDSDKKSVTLRIFAEGPQLYSQLIDESKTRLHAVTQNHFRYSDESVATSAFIEHKNRMYYQGDIGNFVKIHSE